MEKNTDDINYSCQRCFIDGMFSQTCEDCGRNVAEPKSENQGAKVNIKMNVNEEYTSKDLDIANVLRKENAELRAVTERLLQLDKDSVEYKRLLATRVKTALIDKDILQSKLDVAVRALEYHAEYEDVTIRCPDSNSECLTHHTRRVPVNVAAQAIATLEGEL